MVSRTKFKYIKPGLWIYGTLRIRKIVTGGYWIYLSSPYPNLNSRDRYIPKIIIWTISRNGIRLRSTVSFHRARKIAKLFSQ